MATRKPLALVSGAVQELGASDQVPIANVPTGTSGSTAALGNDSRFSDARTPTAHASTHAAGGSDPIALPLVLSTPYSLGNLTGAPAAIDPTAGNNPYGSVTGNITGAGITFTGAGASGQLVLLELNATAIRSVAVTATMTTGLVSPFSLASGKTGFFLFRYSVTLGAWVLLDFASSL